jgi:hypothetical protein
VRAAPSAAQAAYRQLSLVAPGPLFAQPRWLDATLGPQGWDAVVNTDPTGAPIAGLALPLLRKGPFRMVDLPVFTPHIGPLLARSPDAKPVSRTLWVQAQLHALLAQVPAFDYFYLELPPHTDTVPFHHAGYTVLHRTTHLLDLTPPEETLWQGLKSSLRGQIRKAQPRLQVQLHGHRVADAAWLHACLADTYARQGKRLPLSRAQLDRTLQGLLPADYTLLAAADTEGQPQASLLLLHHMDTATVWLSAQTPMGKSMAAASLLHWEAVRRAKALGCHTLDLEGSLQPGIATFYRTLGALPVPYAAVRRVRHPLLRLRHALRRG